MIKFFLSCNRDKVYLTGIIFLLVFLFYVESAMARNIIKGQVKDFITNSAIVGSVVEVQEQGNTIGRGNSDPGGFFIIDYTAAQSNDLLTISITHDQYESLSEKFNIRNGKPEKNSYSFSMLPNSLGGCRISFPHIVIVGNYLSATSEQYYDLPLRIARSLEYNLNPALQKIHVATDLQPAVIACNEVKPRALFLSSKYAEALKADALLTGEVIKLDSNYTVTTHVSDRYGKFYPPLSAISEKVNLNNPGAAKLSPHTLSHVLAAIAVSYEQVGKFAECVDATVAAEQISGKVDETIKTIRSRCQANLANHGLLGENNP